MKVVVSERSVTLGTFSLPCVVPGLQALKTEHVKALCQNGVFFTGITTRTRQLCLKKKEDKFRYIWTSSSCQFTFTTLTKTTSFTLPVYYGITTSLTLPVSYGKKTSLTLPVYYGTKDERPWKRGWYNHITNTSGVLW